MEPPLLKPWIHTRNDLSLEVKRAYNFNLCEIKFKSFINMVAMIHVYGMCLMCCGCVIVFRAKWRLIG